MKTAAQSPKKSILGLLAWCLCSVLGPLLPPVTDPGRVQYPTNDMISNGWQVSYTTASNQYD